MDSIEGHTAQYSPKLMWPQLKTLSRRIVFYGWKYVYDKVYPHTPPGNHRGDMVESVFWMAFGFFCICRSCHLSLFLNWGWHQLRYRLQLQCQRSVLGFDSSLVCRTRDLWWNVRGFPKCRLCFNCLRKDLSWSIFENQNGWDRSSLGWWWYQPLLAIPPPKKKRQNISHDCLSFMATLVNSLQNWQFWVWCPSLKQ